MKIHKRDTHSRVMSRRITSPEFRERGGKKILLLSFADLGSNRQHLKTDKDLFLYAAGSNEEGEVPSGLDRLFDHQFQIHKNEAGDAIGIDIVGARLYRSGLVPKSQDGVDTLRIVWELGGRVCRVDKRPYNTRAELSFGVINELDKLIQAGKELETGMAVGGLGRIVDVGMNSVEIKLKAIKQTVLGAPPSAESIAADA